MTEIFLFDLLNTCLRVAVTIIVAYKLIEFYEEYKGAERLGLGMLGSGSFLTVPPIWAYRLDERVFDGWSVSVMTAGILLMLFGRMNRHIRHRAANAAHAAQMEEELRQRRAARENPQAG